MFWDPLVPKILRKYNEEGYTIVIFSNQGGVEKKKQNLVELKGKVDDLVEQVSVPILCYFATSEDTYRKPNTTQFLFFFF